MTPDEDRALLDRLEALEREAGWFAPNVEHIRMRGPTVAAFCDELMKAYPDLLRLARRGLLAEDLRAAAWAARAAAARNAERDWQTQRLLWYLGLESAEPLISEGF